MKELFVLTLSFQVDYLSIYENLLGTYEPYLNYL